MNINLIKICTFLIGSALFLCSCSTEKLEARLEANPQCKDVINAKTGALMPCPGSDKAFYREVGLAPAKPVPIVNDAAAPLQAAPVTTSSTQSSTNNLTQTVSGSPKTFVAPVECKPQIHKKTGGTLPCPAAD